MEMRRIWSVLVLVVLMSLAIGVLPADADVLKTTTARKCFLANDILCVNHQTTYEFLFCDEPGACRYLITDRISGSARLLPGDLQGSFRVLSPTNVAFSAGCSWPGLTTTGCTVTKTFQLTVLHTVPGSECKDFTLVSSGTARVVQPLGTILAVSSEKTDRFRMCVDSSGNPSITAITTPPPPPVPL